MGKDCIIDSYKKLKTELNKVPTRKDLQKVGISKRRINNLFGSFSGLKELVGDKLPEFVPETRECCVCSNSFITTSDSRGKTYC